MLRELHISGLGVIEDLDLEFHPGLNVLTGETGAGKTMVTVGLMLALGGRATATLVRTGAGAARVQARFDAGREADEWAEDGEVILARSVTAEGRGSARIGGQIATASALGALGAHLVEVHGQHGAQRLLSATTQTAFCDRFAGDPQMAALAGYRDSFERLRGVQQGIAELTVAARDRERELDLLAYQVREIESVAPLPGEREMLAVEEGRLAHVERLLARAGEAAAALGEDGVADGSAAAAAALADAASLDAGAGELSARAAALAADATELARDVRDYRESLEADPARLDQVRERVHALAALEKKYGATEEEVLRFLADARERLTILAGADDRREALIAEAAALSATTQERATALTAGRAAAAPALAAALQAELVELGMEGAAVRVELVPLDEQGPAGAERIEVRLAGAAGQEPLPLGAAASGGELSRTMLACRSVLADLDSVPTLVFDEVDAGIGGAAGLAVGRRLARLAQDRQVVVVTHLPQIACFADRQFRVTKDGGTATVRLLDEKARVEELARMLAGLPGSDGASSHAEELLLEARRVKAGLVGAAP
ncbi:MAG: DNA repair protein RecN [Actinomycetota bacterium]